MHVFIRRVAELSYYTFLLAALLIIFLPGVCVGQLTGAWNQVNTEGFGDTHNWSAFSLASYDGRIYAGTHNRTRGCDIWRRDGEGSNDWTRVASNGFGNANNRTAYSMAVYSNRLYVGTSCNNGFEVWVYDGSTWTNIAIGGITNSGDRQAQSMQVYDGKLYLGSGWRGRVYAYDGSQWTQANITGFGNNNNEGIRSLASFQGKLYAGVYNDDEYANLYRYDGPNPTDWTLITNGGFNGNYEDFRSLAAYHDRLYIGSAGWNIACQVWVYDGTNCVRSDSGGLQWDSVRCMEVFGDRLYIGTGNDSGSPEGGQVWEYDGVSGIWTQVNQNGFGNTDNDAVHALQGNGPRLFAGVPNSASDGGKVFMNSREAYADLGVEKTVDDATPDYGDVVTFALLLTNNGPDYASGIVVTDAVPVELTSPGVTVSAGTWADGQWSVSNLPNGATATLTLTGTVESAGMTNRATIIALEQVDTNSLNDQAECVCIPNPVPPFKNVTGETTTQFVEWRLNRQTGTLLGNMSFCNKATSTRALLGPFWYEVQPSAEYYLMHPDGTNPDDGLPYVDITDQVTAQLSDGQLDPGECVIVTNIELYFHTRVPVVGMVYAVWADPPAFAGGGETATSGVMPFNDFNGDGLSDLAVYDLAGGNWYIRSLGPVSPDNPPITFGQNWGGFGLGPVIGDYDGDGLCDLAVYNAVSGTWYIRSLGPVGLDNPPITFGQEWGGDGLVAVPGDYDGDGIYDLAVYDLVTGDWYIRSLGPVGPDNPPIVFGQNWGGVGMTPVPGDYDGDGLFDLAVYDRATGSWFILPLGAGDPLVFGEVWGTATAIPVPGDYDGDGRFDMAHYEPATGNWSIKSLNGSAPIAVDEQWGGSDLIPVPGDYNQDGKYDLAVYDFVTGTWYIRSLGDSVPIAFGQNWGGVYCAPVGGQE